MTQDEKQQWIAIQAGVVMATWKLGMVLTEFDVAAVVGALEHYDVPLLERAFRMAKATTTPPEFPRVADIVSWVEQARKITGPRAQDMILLDEGEEAREQAALWDSVPEADRPKVMLEMLNGQGPLADIVRQIAHGRKTDG